MTPRVEAAFLEGAQVGAGASGKRTLKLRESSTDPSRQRSMQPETANKISEGQKPLSKAESAYVWQAYFTTILIVVGLITFIFASRGALVVCKVLVYLLALSTMKLAVKYVYRDEHFGFPKFVTATHFLAGLVAAVCICLYRYIENKVVPKIPSVREFFTAICPVGLTFAASIASNNQALLFSTVAFTEIVGSATPLVTVGMLLICGRTFSNQLLFPVLIVAVGCALCTSGEVNFSTLGALLAVSANIFRAIKVMLQADLLIGNGANTTFDPVTLLAWLSIPSLVVMVCWSAATEGYEPVTMLTESPQRHRIISAVLVSCVNATVLNLAVLFVIKDLGAVGTQLVSQAKAILTVLGGMTIFQEEVSSIEVVGFAFVMYGVYYFNRVESAMKAVQEKDKGEKAKPEQEQVLQTSREKA